MNILIVRAKSGLPEEKFLAVAEERAPEFRKLHGLMQKYYVRFPATGEIGGIYVWESEESMKKYRESELARTIASAYQTEGAPDIQIAEVLFPLRT